MSPAPTFAGSPSALPLSPLLSRAALASVAGFQYAFGVMSRNYSLSPGLRLKASASGGCARYPFSFGRPLSLGRGQGVGQVGRFLASARRGRRIASADFSPAAVACGRGRSSLSPVRGGGFRGALTSVCSPWFVAVSARANPPVDPVPFGHWTLRDEAAQRRSPARWGSQETCSHE